MFELVHMGITILTAAGFYNPKLADFLKSKLTGNLYKRVAIVTTASKDKESNKYAQLAKIQLLELGYTDADFIDLEKNLDPGIFQSYDTVYVCGGNSFKLLNAARNANFKSSLERLLGREGIYIGVSAGSILLCPSIQIANEVHPDVNEIGMIDFNALHFVEETIYPHYESSHEDEVKNYETSHKVAVTRLTNNQSVIFENGIRTLID